MKHVVYRLVSQEIISIFAKKKHPKNYDTPSIRYPSMHLQFFGVFFSVFVFVVFFWNSFVVTMFTCCLLEGGKKNQLNQYVRAGMK